MTSRIRLVRALLIGIGLQALTGCISGPTLAAAVSQTPPIQAGLARVWFLRQFGLGKAWPRQLSPRTACPWVKACLVLCSCAILRREPTLSRCRATGSIFGKAAIVQLPAGTPTYLEVQSLRSWAGAGGDNFQRDTLYVRAILPYWADKYFSTLTYLGQG